MSHGLSDKECAWMERIEKETDKVWDDLTPWEQRFIEDMLEKFRRYGDQIRISPKQWEILTRISEKII
jgi:hypothetical protein